MALPFGGEGAWHNTYTKFSKVSPGNKSLNTSPGRTLLPTRVTPSLMFRWFTAKLQLLDNVIPFKAVHCSVTSAISLLDVVLSETLSEQPVRPIMNAKVKK